MIAEELINQMVPPLKPSDQAGQGLDWMDEFRCNQLPVVADERFLGFVTSDTLIEGNSRDRRIDSLTLTGEDCQVGSDAHFFEILKVSADYKLQMVAVRNEVGRYCGVITTADVMSMFAQTASVQMAGSILVISMDMVQYSMAEIARLIEENKARILGSAMLEDPADPARIRLVLKIDQADLSRVVATLERFDYKIVGRYQSVQHDDVDRDRYESLMRYLNI